MRSGPIHIADERRRMGGLDGAGQHSRLVGPRADAFRLQQRRARLFVSSFPVRDVSEEGPRIGTSRRRPKRTVDDPSQLRFRLVHGTRGESELGDQARQELVAREPLAELVEGASGLLQPAERDQGFDEIAVRAAGGAG